MPAQYQLPPRRRRLRGGSASPRSLTTTPIRRCATLAVAAIAATAGCTTTTAGHQQPAADARRATELTKLLLTAEEINEAMNTTGMTVDATSSALADDSTDITPADCLAVSSVGQEQVYAGTEITAASIQSLRQPGQRYTHLAQQSAVEFPTPEAATAFYDKARTAWTACAPGSYAQSSGASWTVVPLEESTGMLTASSIQEGTVLLCQHALTAAAAVIVDVRACSSDPASSQGALTIAQQIANRVAK